MVTLFFTHDGGLMYYKQTMVSKVLGPLISQPHNLCWRPRGWLAWEYVREIYDHLDWFDDERVYYRNKITGEVLNSRPRIPASVPLNDHYKHWEVVRPVRGPVNKLPFKHEHSRKCLRLRELFYA